jgi:hypothetical protein
METMAGRLMAMLLALALLVGIVPSSRAAEPPSGSQTGAVGPTPPRLSYTHGEVSFWRPGAQDWAPAQINTPLAPGDEVSTGTQGDLELQVGSQAFVRAWGDTQLGLVSHEVSFLQLKATTGHVSLDLRSLPPGYTVELDTPHAAFTIQRPGYYRADVSEAITSFSARHAGQATLTSAGGPVVIAAGEGVVLGGAPTPTVRREVAPELDVWDHWNDARTEHLLQAESARYVPPDVYGADELDRHGSWRVVQPYGPVWMPQAMPAGWVPYSTGRWISDPYYGWTWVDAAPWGWAPYHYGRWVFVDGVWVWAPGPVVRRAVYAPALVAFFGGHGVQVGIGAPFVSWVALGWGEPLVPWWGRPGFVGRPWWAGWGGPRVVNNVVVQRTTVVNVNNITVYRNVNVRNAVVAIRRDHFGARSVQEARIRRIDVRRLEPVRGPLHVRPEAGSPGAARGPAARPPAGAPARPVAVTPRPVDRPVAPRGEGRDASPGVGAPAPRTVSPPRAAEPARTPARPPSGERQVERQRSSSPSSLVTPHAVAAPPSRERLESSRPSMRAFPRESANGPSPRGAEMRRHREPRGARPPQSEQRPAPPRERNQR